MEKITDSGVGLGGQAALLCHSNINTIRIYTMLSALDFEKWISTKRSPFLLYCEILWGYSTEKY